jgi:hypothetical protein
MATIPPYRPVDALASIAALRAKLPHFYAGPVPGNLLLKQDALALPGRAAIRGPRQVLDYLEGKGIRLSPTSDGSSVLVRAKSGRLDPALREAIRATARLLAGELTGNPVSCELCRGRGKDRQPAVTVIEVDIAACESCASEEHGS